MRRRLLLSLWFCSRPFPPPLLHSCSLFPVPCNLCRPRKRKQPILQISRPGSTDLAAKCAAATKIPFQALKHVLCFVCSGGRRHLRRNQSVKPSSGCGQIFIFHQVVQPVASAALTAQDGRFTD